MWLEVGPFLTRVAIRLGLLLRAPSTNILDPRHPSISGKKPLLHRCDSASAFVAGDYAVTDMHDAVGVLGDIGFMGD
jgi:hypothetical protein